MKIVVANKQIFSELVSFHLSLSEVVFSKSYFAWPKALFLSELQQSKFLVYLEENIKKDEKSSNLTAEKEHVQAYLGYREGLDFLELILIAVHQNERGKGIAAKLLNYLQKISAETNKKILLEVHQDNIGAINLYCRVGFKEIHLRKKYYQDGASALVMEWQS